MGSKGKSGSHRSAQSPAVTRIHEVFHKDSVTDMATAEKLAITQRDMGDGVLRAAQATHITDTISLVNANELLLSIARAKKQVEERRLIFVKPLKDHVKMIEGLFRPAADVLEQADELLRQKVLGWRKAEAERFAAEQRKRDEAAEAARKAAEEAQAKAERAKGKKAEAAEAIALAATDAANMAQLSALSAPVQPRVMAGEAGQVAARKSWTFEVVDYALVPREFLAVDPRAIRAAVRDGARSIPGVRIFEEETLAVGGL